MNLSKNKADTMIRIASLFVDFFLFLIFDILILTNIVSMIISAIPSYKETYMNYEAALLDTGLYEKDENDTVYLILDDFNADKIPLYEEKIVSLYQRYDAVDQLDNYQASKKLSNTGFILENGNYIPGSNINLLEKFYNNAYAECLNYVITVDENLSSSYGKLNSYFDTINFTSIVLSSLIFYLLIPFMTKNGQTLGKLFFKLYVVEAKSENESLSKLKVLIRQGSFIIVELIFSQFTYYIPAIVSFICMIVTKNKISLHDLIAGTVVLGVNSNKKEVESNYKGIKIGEPLNNVDDFVNKSIDQTNELHHKN